MIQVTQSPFLQALGYAIINSLWQFALLWLLYILITSVGKMSSHKRFVTGLVFQLSGFTWFIITLLFYYQQSQQFSASASSLSSEYVANIIAATESGSGKEKFFAYLLKTEQFLPYLSIAYLALLLFLSLKWMQAYRYTKRIKVEGISKIDVDWRLFVQKLAQQMGITRTVKIYLSDLVSSPLTIGFLKPIILVPLASINHLTTHQVEAVLLHELAHIKRYDYVVNIALSIIEAVLFFNPFMQLLSRYIKRERENCCDDWVLQYEYNATTYAKALLKLATFNGATPALAMHAAADKHILLKRVKRMIEKNERTFNYRHQLLALLLMTGILSSIAWFSPTHNRNKVAHKATTPVTFEPLAARIDNPLFNPVSLFTDNNEIDEPLVETEKVTKRAVVTIHNVPIATSHVQRDYKIEDIAPPVINDHDFVAKRMIDIRPSPYFYFSDSAARGQIRRISSVSFWKELERNEVKMKQANATLAKLKRDAKTAPMAMKQVETVLDRAKQSQTELMRLAEGVKNNNQLLQLEQLRALSLKAIDVKKLNEQISQQMEEVQKQMAMATTWTSVSGDDDDDDVSTYVTAAPLVEKPHSYSYEYSNKPKLKTITNAKAQVVYSHGSGTGQAAHTDCSCPAASVKVADATTKPVSPAPVISIRVHNGKVIKVIRI
jgi:beta-lactamase regulating signal transducer with metallopeptidase domain